MSGENIIKLEVLIMSLKYSELFKPFNIGKCKIKNRIVMAPMHVTGRLNENGSVK